MHLKVFLKQKKTKKNKKNQKKNPLGWFFYNFFQPCPQAWGQCARARREQSQHDRADRHHVDRTGM